MRNLITLILILFCVDANATVPVSNYFSHTPVQVCVPSDSNSNCGGGGVSSITIGTTSPLTGAGTGSSFTLGINKATTSVDGYLSAADFTTFNNKQASGSYLTSVTIGTTSPVTGAGSGSSFTLGVDQSKLTLSSIGGAVTDSQVPDNITITNLSGTNTGDQTITLTGDVTGSGTGSFAATIATVNKPWQDGGTNVYETTTTDRVGIGTTTASSLASLEVMKQSSLAPLMVSSVATGAGDYLIMNSDGNVGIGTRGPSNALEVNGTVKATTFSGAGTSLTGTASSLTAGNVTTNANLTGDVTSIGNATTIATVNKPWQDGGTNLYETTTTDLVGIGTTTPTTTFEIVKQSSSAPLMISSVATGDGDYFIINSAGNIGIGTVSPRSAFVVIGGNVGVGTTNPQATVEISGPANQSTIAGGLNISSGNLGIGSATPGALIDVPGKVRILSGGNLIFGGTAPTIATNDCGSTVQGTVTSKSTNNSGSITAGTLNVTSCAMTFNTATPFVNAPFCMCQDDTNILGCKVSSTTTKMTITTTTSMSSDVIAYHCFGGE